MNHPPEAPADTSPRPVLPLTLPATFEAFHTRNYPHYLRYARLHLASPRDASELVNGVFGDLVTSWPHVLSRANSTAYAWTVFTRRMREATAGPGQRCPRAPGPYAAPADPRALTGRRSDIAVLSRVLRYTVREIADLTGTPAAHVRAALRAHRCPAPAHGVPPWDTG